MSFFALAHDDMFEPAFSWHDRCESHFRPIEILLFYIVSYD